MDDLVVRFSTREPLTQSLAYAAALQDRGWGCIVAGGALLIMRTQADGLTARMQRPRMLDIPLLYRLAQGTGLKTMVIEPALSGYVWTKQEHARWSYVVGDSASDAPLQSLGWRSVLPLAHTRTRLIDLSHGPEATLGQMGGTARRNIRIAQRSGVHYSTLRFDQVSAELLIHIDALWTEFRRSRPWLKQDAEFRAAIVRRFADSGWMCLAYDGLSLVGVVYLLIHDRVGSYYAAFTTASAPSDRVPTGLVWTAIRQSIEVGCDLFDFVGLWDERWPERYPRWKGFSTFKRRFGGVDVALAPAYQVEWET